MQYRYFFRIVDTMISLMVPKKLNINDSYKDFLTEEWQKADITVVLQDWKEGVTFEAGIRVYRGGYDVYKTTEGFAIGLSLPDTGEIYFFMPVMEDSDTWTGYVKESEWWRFRSVADVFRAVSLEKILNRNKTLLLHSSFIEWKKEAILFTAPSGTGKSTQADLWNKYEAAEIINGDRAALVKKEDGWQAYGLPLAGSSDIFRNETYPIKAIVVLRQGKENNLERLKPVEAFRWIYSEVIVQYWDEIFQKNLIEELTDLVQRIPIYRLECLPDQSAVEILKKELEVYEYGNGTTDYNTIT